MFTIYNSFVNGLKSKYDLNTHKTMFCNHTFKTNMSILDFIAIQEPTKVIFMAY